jgi:polyhydroxyalkanoate synthase subunit PhaC
VKTFIHLRDTIYNASTNFLGFNEKIFNIFSEAYSVYLKTILEDDNVTKDLPDLEKIVKSRISNIFNLRFREADFVSTLSDTVASYSTLAKSTGFGQLYQSSSIWWANWNNNFIEPIRDIFWRTPSYKIAELEKYSLFRLLYYICDSSHQVLRI